MLVAIDPSAVPGEAESKTATVGMNGFPISTVHSPLLP